MTISIRFGTTAEDELIDATHWYEEHQPGLGQRFVAAVDVTIGSLSLWPRADTPVEGTTSEAELRRAPVKRFPHHLGYLITDDVMIVLAVAHHHRRPGFWHQRAR